MATNWYIRREISGALFVTRGGYLPGRALPELFVYGPSVREVLCRELAEYLNGGERPPWLSNMRRVPNGELPDKLLDADGTMIIVNEPWQPWEAGFELIDLLCPRQAVAD